MVSPSAIKTERRAPALPKIGIAGWLRVAIRLVGLLVALAAMIPCHFLTHALGRHSHWPRRFLGTAAWLIGARVRSLGTAVPANVLFLANHLSWIDILAMGGATGTAFIAKAEVKSTPVVGWLADINRTLYVAREDRLGVAEQIARVRDAMAENHAITVFPEGTTGDGTALLPFKSSLLGVLEPPPAGLVVQPVLIDYGDAPEAAWVGDEPGLHHALRVLGRAGSFAFTLTFLAPFDPLTVGNRKAVAAEAHSRLHAALADLNACRAG